MNGAESLVHSLLRSGVTTCFANPGTSEMHFVAALDRIPGMYCVLGLQENIVTGMADGYFRIAGKPACTLLHCGPGLANGLGNLHNARRARSGIVNIVGDHATYHRPFDSPLTADTDGLARSVSAWVRTSVQAAELGQDGASAVQAAKAGGGQIATLILPSDASWNPGGVVAEARPAISDAAVDPEAIRTAARMLRGKQKTLLLLAGRGISAKGQDLAWRIAAKTGASIMGDYVNAIVPRGYGRLALERVPYSSEAAIAALSSYENIILVCARAPVGFFAYPGLPSLLHPQTAQIHVLARPEQDPLPALEALVDELSAPPVPMPDHGPRPAPAQGAPSPEKVAQTIAALIPEHAIVSDESVSYGRGFYKNSHAAPPHDWLHLTGGAIGDGLPVATGAAIAAERQRRVISLQADGSAMYSLQSLWTQARERLPCTTIILSNRKYAILLGEYGRVGASPGQTAMDMLDLGNPAIDWVGLANSLGVPAVRATTMEACNEALSASFNEAGPFLVELMV